MDLNPELTRKCLELAVTIDGKPANVQPVKCASDAHLDNWQLTPEETREEKLFQARLTGYATYRGWTWHHHTISLKSKEGFLDLVLIREVPGKVMTAELVVAELKVQNRVMSSAQKVWYHLWSQVPNAKVFLWYPSDWQKILEVLR